MEYKKSELTKFAKDCAYGSHQMIIGVCMAEEISKSDIGRKFANGIEDELLIEISKRFAKHAKEECMFDVETADVQNFQNIIERIIECCEDNNWFENAD